MKTAVGINGFGRIGRGFFRAASQDREFMKKFDIVAINDITGPETLAHLLRYDSVYGAYPHQVDVKKNALVVAGKTLRILSERDPANLPWKKLQVEIVLESTGLFTKRKHAKKHIQAGARKVIITAPSSDPDATIVLGVNDAAYDRSRHRIISMASCTTNCLAPIVKVLNDAYGIDQGFLTTCHAYTNDQSIHDQPHNDLRRARAATMSIIPTTTGAAKAIGKVVPEVEGRMDGIALRVPVPDGSINDIVLRLRKKVTVRQLNSTLKRASRSKFKGIIEYTEEPLVSSDIVGNRHSAIVDGLSTNVIGGRGNLVKVMAWYDNELGFSSRLVDLVKFMSRREHGESGK